MFALPLGLRLRAIVGGVRGELPHPHERVHGVRQPLGGDHIPTDNDVGLRVGREIAVWSWPRYRAFWEATAQVRE